MSAILTNEKPEIDLVEVGKELFYEFTWPSYSGPELDADDVGDDSGDDQSPYRAVRVRLDEKGQFSRGEYSYVWSCGDGCCSETEKSELYSIPEWLRRNLLPFITSDVEEE